MVWDKSLPRGDRPIAEGDNAIRDNNDAVEDALNLEHNFSGTTAEDQTGRHKFYLDSDPTNDISDAQPGGIAFDTSLIPQQKTAGLVYWDGFSWRPADPKVPEIVRFDYQNRFTTTQWAEWHQITLEDNGGWQIPLDLSQGPAQWAEVNQSPVEIQQPTFLPVHTTTLYLFLQMDSTAGRVVNWDQTGPAQFVSAAGGRPVIANGAFEITMVTITATTTRWLVSSQPYIAPFPATAGT